MEIPPEVYAKACAKKVLKLVNLVILAAVSAMRCEVIGLS